MDKKKVTINTEEFLSIARKYRHSTTMNTAGQFTSEVVDSYAVMIAHIDERLNELVDALEMVRFELMAKQGNAITFTNDQWAQILIALKKVRGE